MTLQEQYNRIKEGKGSKHIFLTEAKKQFSSMLTNPMGFGEASTILKQRGVITENYIDLQPINTIEATPKTAWENKFESFISEAKKEAKEENIKVDSKKVDKSVEETQDHNFDYKDQKNLDNQIGQEVLNGIYFEAKQNPDKSLDEIRKIVLKNLEKDRQYYMKNAAFGVEGLGYQETEVEEVSGKYKASGYSDKLKKLVKESLVKENDYDNRNLYIPRLKEGDRLLVDMGDGTQETVTVARTFIMAPPKGKREPVFTSKEYGEDMWFTSDMVIDNLKESYDEFQRDDKGSKDVDAKNKGEEEAFGAGVEKGEKIEKKKMKKESLESRLSKIDKQGAIVALEAKIDMVGEAIENKNNRISMVSEDENLSELVDKTKIKAMRKEVKLLEKQKAKMEKMYEKMCGKSYTKEEVIDETLEGNE